MTDMHFDGSIIKADFHSNPEPLESYVELRIMIDVKEEIMIEVAGTEQQLKEKFGVEFSALETGNIGLVGEKCNVLRNASGYHFISMEN
ncbi:MAG: hypothetical protein H7258_01000 [Ferruginibacter sp.]|nr:hypothetical protein [Ferruginibacter sp.]